ncbi:hypothetical protein [Legionella sainthelensi]|uniref:hypothetical protein n=1 Tax=Legionella sainthelensi TaxID=28087 RepID=UPI0012DDBD22|nr:hypothetical protein [Legionella sainthelensi]
MRIFIATYVAQLPVLSQCLSNIQGSTMSLAYVSILASQHHGTPNFEIEKNILTNNSNRASKQSEYSRERADLYLLEINKLRTGEPVDYLLSEAFMANYNWDFLFSTELSSSLLMIYIEFDIIFFMRRP